MKREVTLVNDTTAARRRLGMPDKFGSCHTATVSGYVLEGHVPAVDVKKLLASKPAVVGLAGPGMPQGSPGMEVGTRQDPLQGLHHRQARTRDRVRVLSQSLKEQFMKFTQIAAACGLVISLHANAQTAPTSAADHSAHHAAASAPTTDGEVRKVDKEQGKVTLKHGLIANLEMPGMTMVFKVSDPKLLDSIKEGDKVKFSADKVNGAITVTAIEPIR